MRSGKLLFAEHRQTPHSSPEQGHGGPSGICCVNDLHSSYGRWRKGVFRPRCATVCANLIAVNLLSGVLGAGTLQPVSTGLSASLRKYYSKRSVSQKTRDPISLGQLNFVLSVSFSVVTSS